MGFVIFLSLIKIGSFSIVNNNTSLNKKYYIKILGVILTMMLFYSPIHGFIHKVLVVAHEAGLWDKL